MQNQIPTAMNQDLNSQLWQEIQKAKTGEANLDAVASLIKEATDINVNAKDG